MKKKKKPYLEGDYSPEIKETGLNWEVLPGTTWPPISNQTEIIHPEALVLYHSDAPYNKLELNKKGINQLKKLVKKIRPPKNKTYEVFSFKELTEYIENKNTIVKLRKTNKNIVKILEKTRAELKEKEAQYAELLDNYNDVSKSAKYNRRNIEKLKELQDQTEAQAAALEEQRETIEKQIEEKDNIIGITQEFYKPLIIATVETYIKSSLNPTIETLNQKNKDLTAHNMELIQENKRLRGQAKK